MTGFGKCVVESNDNTFSIEIRTLNSKQLDINLRAPVYLKEYELEIRNILNKKIQRGKTDVNISVENKTVATSPVINHQVAEHYYKELTKLSNTLNLNSSDDILSIILRMPDVMDSPEESVGKEDWKIIENGIVNAIAEVDAFRISEGKILEDDFAYRIKNIKRLLIDIEPFEETRISRIRTRIKSNFENISDDVQLDKNRLEQEMIYYLEKLDITEEKIRLKKHCEYFLETMNNEKLSGKKLSFISQEIGREVNTIGSKANDADIQKLVVLMKDELEKIKEQIFNIL